MKSVAALFVLAAALFTLPAAIAAPAAPREQRIAMTVTRNGFEPATVHLKAGHPVRLVVTRKVERTCATDLVVASLGIRKPLPLNQPVVIRFTPRKAGQLRYACAMDMIGGTFVVD